jgi:hypothetical protein
LIPPCFSSRGIFQLVQSHHVMANWITFVKTFRFNRYAPTDLWFDFFARAIARQRIAITVVLLDYILQ